MKIAIAASFCLVALIGASVSTDAKTVKLHLRVNVDDKSVTLLKAPEAVAFSSGLVAKHLSKGFFAKGTRLSKAATTATSEDDEEDYKIRACESVAVQPWVGTLEYACSVGSPTDGYDFAYKLANGTYFANDRCDSSDKAGLDTVFAKAMEGAELKFEDVDGFSVQCFSRNHASYVVKDHPEYDSEFEFIADQFIEFFAEDDDEESDDSPRPLSASSPLIASASTDAKVIKIHLRVNAENDSVAVLKADPVDTSDIMDAVSKHGTADKPHTKAAPASALQACESVTIQPWVGKLNYACTWGNAKDGYGYVFKLSDNKYYSNARCTNLDQAGFDKVFTKSMGGAALTMKGIDSFKCYSQQHATYSAKAHPEYATEFDFVLSQFEDFVKDN